MIKRYCDRCGQQIDEGVHAWYVLELHGTDGEFRHKELCEECYEYLCEKDEVPMADRKTEPQHDDEFKNFDREDLILLIECQKERIAELLAKTEPNSSEIPNNCEYEDIFEYCPRCGMRILVSKPKDEPQTERIKTLDYCDICNHKGCDNCIANNLDDYCVPSGYEPTTQTETQNSNLTFEKDECAKEYEELGLKELKELINADRKTEQMGDAKPIPLSSRITQTEPTTEDCSMVRCERIHEGGVSCARYPACDDCAENPLNKVKGSERSVKGSDPLHDDCFDCDKFFTCDDKGDDYKTDCPWK